jgi:hypothetical protein
MCLRPGPDTVVSAHATRMSSPCADHSLSLSLSLPHLVLLVNGMLLGFDMCRMMTVRCSNSLEDQCAAGAMKGRCWCEERKPFGRSASSAQLPGSRLS